MQFIRQLSFFQYRLYAAADFRFTGLITAITGPNGSGKTAILDAVYYLCYTKSYFTAQQQSLARWESPGFRIVGRFEKSGAEETVSARWEGGKKELSVSGIPVTRTTDFIGRYAAVMIAPDDGELILGTSEVRRKWIDSILAQTDRVYFENLLSYNRILQQRNAWLKAQQFGSGPDRFELESYNLRLHEHGMVIYEKRAFFIDAFLPFLNELYHRLSAGAEDVQVIYESEVHEKSIAQWLDERVSEDLRAQRTTRGIHRDDWAFLIHEKPVRVFASQGQRKTLLFALKLAQYQYLKAAFGFSPILLLDDVFEKLDQQRIEALLSIIREPQFGQVLLTDTHAGRVREAFGEEAEIQAITTG